MNAKVDVKASERMAVVKITTVGNKHCSPLCIGMKMMLGAGSGRCPILPDEGPASRDPETGMFLRSYSCRHAEAQRDAEAASN